MNDKEMLELAAKSAGVHAGFINEYGGGKTFCWNPLKDDGDAARLATDLQLSILWFTTLQYVMVERRGVGENIGWIDEAGRGGALRRAITVVAAKIGTSLP